MKARSRAAARKVVVVRRSKVGPVVQLAREDRAAMDAGADAAGGGGWRLAIGGCKGGAVAAISLLLAHLMAVVVRMRLHMAEARRAPKWKNTGVTASYLPNSARGFSKRRLKSSESRKCSKGFSATSIRWLSSSRKRSTRRT